MSLSDLASLDSLISGFAVLISLLFLYFQLRQMNAQVLQSEKNQRALVNQGAIHRSSEVVMWLADHSALLARNAAGEHEFTADEILQLTLAQRVSFVASQDVYVQHKAGLADQITLENNLGALKAQLAAPGNRAIWKMARASYAPEWAAFIDKLIEETPLAEPVDRVTQFKTSLAEVMR